MPKPVVIEIVVRHYDDFKPKRRHECKCKKCRRVLGRASRRQKTPSPYEVVGRGASQGLGFIARLFAVFKGLD